MTVTLSVSLGTQWGWGMVYFAMQGDKPFFFLDTEFSLWTEHPTPQSVTKKEK